MACLVHMFKHMFSILNNITRISIHFFTYTNFQKKWKLFFKHTYQTGPYGLLENSRPN